VNPGSHVRTVARTLEMMAADGEPGGRAFCRAYVAAALRADWTSLAARSPEQSAEFVVEPPM